MRLEFFRQDLTSGNIFKNIVLNTIPLWIGTLFYVGLMPWELYIVGRLGMESMAALAISAVVLMLFWTAIFGMTNITIASIGNLVGQKDTRGVSRLAKEILTITLILVIFLATIGYLIAPALLWLLGAKPEVLNLALPYLRILLIGMVVTSPIFVINAMLRGAGDMGIPMIIVCSEIALNGILLFPMFFGLAPFLKMGLNWVALSSVISGGIATIAGILVLRGKSVIKVDLSRNLFEYLPRVSTIKEMVSLVGLNTVEMLFIHISSLVMTRLVANWGTPALAAYGIGQRLLMMTSLPGFDLATTANIIMANNLGAKKVRRAEMSCWGAAGLNLLIMGVGGMILFTFASQVVWVFNKTPEVIKIGTHYLRITTLGWSLLAIYYILRRSFLGAKEAQTPFLISLFGLGGQVILALWLPERFGLGIEGIWWAILFGALFRGSASAVLFRLGRWKPKELKAQLI